LEILVLKDHASGPDLGGALYARPETWRLTTFDLPDRPLHNLSDYPYGNYSVVAIGLESSLTPREWLSAIYALFHTFVYETHRLGFST
jgi:hypothetical protein